MLLKRLPVTTTNHDCGCDPRRCFIACAVGGGVVVVVVCLVVVVVFSAVVGCLAVVTNCCLLFRALVAMKAINSDCWHWLGCCYCRCFSL